MSLAADSLEKILEEARKWKMDQSPKPTGSGKHWKCNGCRFASPHMSAAREHVETNDVPFAHICYEVKIDPGKGKKPEKPRRRILLVKGRVRIEAKEK